MFIRMLDTISTPEGLQPAADIQYRPSREELFDLLLDAS
jgi:hypothetical protein